MVKSVSSTSIEYRIIPRILHSFFDWESNFDSHSGRLDIYESKVILSQTSMASIDSHIQITNQKSDYFDHYVFAVFLTIKRYILFLG